VDLASGEYKILPAKYDDEDGAIGQIGNMLWLPDGSGIVYAGADHSFNRKWEIVLWDAATGKARKLIGPQKYTAEAASGVLPSPDSSKIAYTVVDSTGYTTQIFVLDLATGENTNVTSESSNRDNEPLAWSPDSSQIAFASDDNNASNTGPELWIMSADGSGKTNLGGVDATSPFGGDSNSRPAVCWLATSN
jgi:Tol biopolymer transport system component